MTTPTAAASATFTGQASPAPASLLPGEMLDEDLELPAYALTDAGTLRGRLAPLPVEDGVEPYWATWGF